MSTAAAIADYGPESTTLHSATPGNSHDRGRVKISHHKDNDAVSRTPSQHNCTYEVSSRYNFGAALDDKITQDDVEKALTLRSKISEHTTKVALVDKEAEEPPPNKARSHVKQVLSSRLRQSHGVVKPPLRACGEVVAVRDRNIVRGADPEHGPYWLSTTRSSVLVSLSSKLLYKELLYWQQEQYVPTAPSGAARSENVSRSLARVDSAFDSSKLYELRPCPEHVSGLLLSSLVPDDSTPRVSEPGASAQTPTDAPGKPGHSSLPRSKHHHQHAGSSAHVTGHSGGRDRSGSRGNGGLQKNRGDGGGGSDPPEPLSPSSAVTKGDHLAGFNCVFCGTDHHTVVRGCSTKQRFISRLRRHHESHNFFYCTDCFEVFNDAQSRDVHKRNNQCTHACVTAGCPNRGNFRSADNLRCTHTRNPPRDQWMALFYMARRRFHFTHPEGDPDPGTGEDELDEGSQDVLDEVRSVHLHPPAEHRRPLHGRRHSVHTATSSNLTSPSKPTTDPSASLSGSEEGPSTALASFAGELIQVLTLVRSMQSTISEVSPVDRQVIQQTQINLEFCRGQLAASHMRSTDQSEHQAVLTTAPSGPILQADSTISPGLGASSFGLPQFDYQDSTLQAGTRFGPDLVFDYMDTSDATSQAVPGTGQAQGSLGSPSVIGAWAHEPSGPSAGEPSVSGNFQQWQMPNP